MSMTKEALATLLNGREYLDEITNEEERRAKAAVADLPSPALKSRFSYVNVTSPGADGTINLMWGDYPIQWINSPEIAAEIKEFLDGENQTEAAS